MTSTVDTGDVTLKVIPNLDNHLVIPVLQHLSSTPLYKQEQVSRALLDVIAATDRHQLLT